MRRFIMSSGMGRDGSVSAASFPSRTARSVSRASGTRRRSEGQRVCLNDEAFHHVFRDGEGWERFRREFPLSDGTLRFSRVRLDRGVKQALIYAGQQFDWNVGSGGYRLFTRREGVWTEDAKVGDRKSVV